MNTILAKTLLVVSFLISLIAAVSELNYYNQLPKAMHPLFQDITVRQTSAFGIAINCVAVYSVCSKIDLTWKLLVVHSVYLLFVCYHVGLFLFRVPLHCGCFGNLHSYIGIDGLFASKIAFGVALFVSIGGFILLQLLLHQRKNTLGDAAEPAATS